MDGLVTGAVVVAILIFLPPYAYFLSKWVAVGFMSGIHYYGEYRCKRGEKYEGQ